MGKDGSDGRPEVGVRGQLTAPGSASASRSQIGREARRYGRRRLRSLRKGRALLLDTLLADLEVPVPHGNGLLDVVRLFPRAPRDAWLEIGFGAGEHLAGQAMLHPRIGFIGCEPFVDGIAGLLARIRYNDIANIRVFPDDARLLLPALPEASIGRGLSPVLRSVA